VITGEGAIDRSTLMGKGVGCVSALCARHEVPCIGLAGKLVLNQADNGFGTGCFTRLSAIAPRLTSEETARKEPEVWLPRLAAATAREWKFAGL
jgi:glycerate 2-kinase